MRLSIAAFATILDNTVTFHLFSIINTPKPMTGILLPAFNVIAL